MWPCLLLVLMLLAVAPPWAVAAELVRGVFSLGSGLRPTPDDLLANPDVTGVSLIVSWEQLEPVEGVFDWRYLDAEIQRVAAAGKRVFLRYRLSGLRTPDWVFQSGAATFSFVNRNPYHATYGQRITIPLFWDPIFVEKKKQTIAAIGARYAGHPAIAYVVASCVNAMSDDWVFPDAPEDIASWQAAGYTTAKVIDACAQVIDATAAAFPAHAVVMAVGPTTDELDPDQHYVARAVASYGRTQYPGRFVTSKNNLNARTPDPMVTERLQSWTVLKEGQPDVAAQMLWFVTDDPTCRMDDKTPPCDPARMLEDAVRIARHYGLLFLEIYEKDIRNPDLAAVIHLAAAPAAPPTIDGFVADYYRLVLGRAPSEGEIALWVARLRSEPGAADAMVAWFFNRTATLSRPVTLSEYVRLLYRTILQRAPTDGELTATVAGRMLPAMNLLVPGFVGAGEFQTLARSVPPSQIVHRLSVGVLGRQESAEENQAGVDLFALTGDWMAVALSYLNSPEYVGGTRSFADHIGVLYRTFLGRAPGHAERDGWLAFLGLYLGAIQRELTASEEFQAKLDALLQRQ